MANYLIFTCILLVVSHIHPAILVQTSSSPTTEDAGLEEFLEEEQDGEQPVEPEPPILQGVVNSAPEPEVLKPNAPVLTGIIDSTTQPGPAEPLEQLVEVQEIANNSTRQLHLPAPSTKAPALPGLIDPAPTPTPGPSIAPVLNLAPTPQPSPEPASSSTPASIDDSEAESETESPQNDLDETSDTEAPEKPSAPEESSVATASNSSSVALPNQVDRGLSQPDSQRTTTELTPPAQQIPLTVTPNQSGVPLEVCSNVVNRLSKLLAGNNCTRHMDSRLKPMINKRIRGHVMESSVLLFNLAPAISAAVLNSSPSCKLVRQSEEKKTVMLEVSLNLDLSNQVTTCKWRHYPALQMDDIPLQVPFRMANGRHAIPASSLGLRRNGAKCLEFKVDSGDYYLDLLSFKVSTTFATEVTESEQKGMKILEPSGGIRLVRFEPSQIYLSHRMHSSPPAIGSIKSTSGKASRTTDGQTLPTVQVLHDRNNHHRRNNWLLDMYGNWLQQEHRKQLALMLHGQEFLSQINMCLMS